MKVLSMNSFLVTAGLLAFAAAPASAQSFTLTANLTGAGESTQTTNGINTGAFGDATVIVDVGAQQVTYSVAYSICRAA